ncbi:hypothetical protein [Spirosoma flavus]
MLPNSENNVVAVFCATVSASRWRAVWLIGRLPADTRIAGIGQAEKSAFSTLRATGQAPRQERSKNSVAPVSNVVNGFALVFHRLCVRCCPLRAVTLPGDRTLAGWEGLAAQPNRGVKVDAIHVQ